MDGTTGLMAQSQDLQYDGKQVQQKIVADYNKVKFIFLHIMPNEAIYMTLKCSTKEMSKLIV